MVEKSDFFKDVKIEEVEVSGELVRFPVRYYDQMRISANFPAPIQNVRKLIPSDKLKPVETKPGKTVVVLIAFEYKHLDNIAPYNEFGVFVPVLYKKSDEDQGMLGSYCLHLPVTTERARYGGVAIYGYPKFVADITFEDLGDRVRCRVWADGKYIITLDVKKVETATKTSETYSFTVKDGKILRTLVQTYGLVGTSSIRGGASYILGDHPISTELRSLKIGKTALQYSYMPKLQSLLHKPTLSLPM